MQQSQPKLISITTGAILKAVAIVALLYFAWLIGDILMLLFIALIFATLIDPTVNKMEKFKIPRGASIIIIYILVLLFLGLAVWFLIPPIVEQVTRLSTNFPDLWQRLSGNLESLRQYTQGGGVLETLQQNLRSIQSSLTTAAGGVYSFIVSVFKNIVNFFLLLVITFYLVAQKDSLSKIMKSMAPAQYHSYLSDLSNRISQKIGAWARGQLILGVIIGVLAYAGLWFLLPEYALVLAIFAGITELIPYLGPILGAIPAIFLAFAIDPTSWVGPVSVLVLYFVIQQIENNLLVPRVMNKQVGLNPVTTIIAMLIGARVAGVVGIILAVPVTTAISTVLKDFMHNSALKEEIKKDMNEPG